MFHEFAKDATNRMLVGAAALLISVSAVAQNDAGDGVGKVLTAPGQVPKGAVEGSQDAPVAGTAVGTVEGAGKGAVQAGEGAGEILIAPVKAVTD